MTAEETHPYSWDLFDPICGPSRFFRQEKQRGLVEKREPLWHLVPLTRELYEKARKGRFYHVEVFVSIHRLT